MTIMMIIVIVIIVIIVIIVVIIKQLAFRGLSFWADDMIFRHNVRMLFFFVSLLGPPSWKTLDET